MEAGKRSRKVHASSHMADATEREADGKRVRRQKFAIHVPENTGPEIGTVVMGAVCSHTSWRQLQQLSSSVVLGGRACNFDRRRKTSCLDKRRYAVPLDRTNRAHNPSDAGLSETAATLVEMKSRSGGAQQALGLELF